MSERIFDLPSKNEDSGNGKKDEYAEYADLIAYHEEKGRSLLESQIERSKSMIIKFETLIADFERMYNLKALHAIINLLPEEAPNCPIRKLAKDALVPIVALLNYLKKTQTSQRKNMMN